MNERIRRSTVAAAIVPALKALADLQSALQRDDLQGAFDHSLRLREILWAIEQDVGSVTPMALFGV